MIDMPSGLVQDTLLPRRKLPGRLDFALPTINIIFLLTLYFLLAGTLVSNNEVSDDLPQTLRTATERLPRPLLTLLDDGRMLIDGDPVDRAGLLVAAQGALTGTLRRTLNVVVSGQTSAHPVFSLLSELTAAGIPIRIVTERASMELPP